MSRAADVPSYLATALAGALSTLLAATSLTGCGEAEADTDTSTGTSTGTGTGTGTSTGTSTGTGTEARPSCTERACEACSGRSQQASVCFG
jgi:hypothetical protein